MGHEFTHAHSIRIGVCGDPHCTCVHIQFVDFRDHLFAQASVPVADVPAVIDDLKRIAYHIVTLKGEQADG